MSNKGLHEKAMEVIDEFMLDEVCDQTLYDVATKALTTGYMDGFEAAKQVVKSADVGVGDPRIDGIFLMNRDTIVRILDMQLKDM